MGLKNSQYQTIMREYEQKQVRARDTLARHYTEVYTRLPQLKSMDESISILSVQHGKRLLGGDDNAIASLKKNSQSFGRTKKIYWNLPVFPSTTWNFHMSAQSVRIPVILGARSVAALKEQSAVFFMSNQI